MPIGAVPVVHPVPGDRYERPDQDSGEERDPCDDADEEESPHGYDFDFVVVDFFVVAFFG